MALPSGVRLRNVGNRYLPKYEIYRDNELVGTVARTGSLPSMYHWLAYDAHGVPRGPSSRTRTDAVTKILQTLDTPS